MYPYVGEKMGTNFPGSPNLMDFTAFSQAIENWWGKSCILYIMKYTIGCEPTGKKSPILWEKWVPWLEIDGKSHVFSMW